ncbi:MAG: GNAT family N-acetyltransferase, partial [Rhodocyclaceae bacterium]|nr:GNAT family N-acetyltransferase [Rhodocyclaceae bacterium]
ARLKRALAAGTLLGWIARAEDQSRLQLAGYLTARVQVEDPLFGDTFEYEPVLYIVDVDVEEAYRRRGLSSLLMQHASEHARRQRISTLELAVVVRDDRAVAAWKKQGFEPRVSVMRRTVAKR